MSVRLASPRDQAQARLGDTGAREKLVAAIREVASEALRDSSKPTRRDIPELNAYVVAKPQEIWGDGVILIAGFTDALVDEYTGKPEEHVVAWVEAETGRYIRAVRLYTMKLFPSTWRPLPSLGLLPAAFNAALSALGVEERLSREFGVRLEAKGVTVRRMFVFGTRRRPVVLVDFDVNGRRFTLDELVMWFRRGEGGAWKAFFSCGVLLRHGDRRLAKRLYMLSRLKLELEDALERFCEEKGYSCEGTISSGSRLVFALDLEDRKVEVVRPLAPAVLFDEEYLVLEIGKEHEHRDGTDYAEELAEESGKALRVVEQESSETLAALIQDANRLLGSEDPREKELGHLLAVLIKRAYEEAEMAIPE